MASNLILITGVSGFIGFKTLILALEAGYYVRAIVRKASQIPKLSSHTRIQFYVKNLEFVIIPDLAQTEAFGLVLEGVIGILHLASPLAIETDNYELDIIQPAIDVTNSILEAANRAPSIKRVIITSSAVMLIPFEWLSNPDHERIYTGRDINSNPTRPFHTSMEAYWASKALSRTLTHTFLAEKNPHFEIINLLPSVVIGPDELATKTSDLLTGTRALAMAPLLGVKSEIPLVGQQVHVNDVARAHVDALKPRVPGNADYILTSDSPDGFKWDDVKAMKTFKNGVSGSEGKLKLDGSMPTMKWKIDVSTTEKTFGWKCKPFEETMKDLIGQYLGLLERESEKPMT